MEKDASLFYSPDKYAKEKIYFIVTMLLTLLVMEMSLPNITKS